MELAQLGIQNYTIPLPYTFSLPLRPIPVCTPQEVLYRQSIAIPSPDLSLNEPVSNSEWLGMVSPEYLYTCWTTYELSYLIQPITTPSYTLMGWDGSGA